MHGLAPSTSCGPLTTSAAATTAVRQARVVCYTLREISSLPGRAMVYVDYLIIGIVLVSMLVGFFRGFFPELVGLATWIVAVLGGWHLSSLVEPYLDGKLGSVVAELWAARAIVFVAILVLGGLLGQLVSLLVDKAGLSGTDKTLGLVFGLVRGGLIVGVLVIVAQLMGFEQDEWWAQSKTVPIGEGIASVIRSALPPAINEHLEPHDEPESRDGESREDDAPDEGRL